MTCIVGLVEGGEIYIGADSIGISGLNYSVRADKKVFARDGLIIGSAGSFRTYQTIQYRLKFPKHPEGMEDHCYLCTLFVDAMRAALKAAGTSTEENEEEAQNNNLILGYRGNLYEIQTDYQVVQTYEPFMATGCGEKSALGALYILDMMDLPPEEKVELALKASAASCAGVCGPYTILTSKETEESEEDGE